MRYPVLIFDCDGVIIDSREVIIRGITETAKHFNLHCPSDEDFLKLLNSGHQMMKSYLNLYYANQLSEEKKQTYTEYYLSLRFQDNIAYEGIADCIKLANKNHRLYLVSNRHPQESTQALDNLGLTDCFSGIFGVMEPMFRPKPNRDMFLPIQADCANLPVSSFLMIGDTQADLLFAQSVGIDFAYCQYGHGDPSTILNQKPTHVVESPQALYQLLESFQ